MNISEAGHDKKGDDLGRTMTSQLRVHVKIHFQLVKRSSWQLGQFYWSGLIHNFAAALEFMCFVRMYYVL